MIDDQDLEQNVDDPSHVSNTSQDDADEEEGQVLLEHLPRPVNELNCRQARTFLVKLLRTANGGMNPHYGNPDMKPAFWPGKKPPSNYRNKLNKGLFINYVTQQGERWGKC